MNKRELTKLFLTQAGNTPTKDSVTQALMHWWTAPYSTRGFQLTFKGFCFLKDTLQLTNYAYRVKDDFEVTMPHILLLSKHIQHPFFLLHNSTGTTLTLFGESDAAMMGLYSGDLKQYLLNFSRI
jgi:hypothetical protein